MAETESKRLAKVAKELNVGVGHLVETLAKKGHTIDNNPNAKISGDVYAILLNEYQGDKKVKDDSKKLDILKPKKDIIPVVEIPVVVEAPKKVEEKIPEPPKPEPTITTSKSLFILA